MNQNFSQEQILVAYRAAPEPVREAFNSEATTQVVIDLQTKHQLHVDQAGIIGKEIAYLLVGLTNPAQFADRLRGSGFAEPVVQDVMKEINEKVFMPLREELRKGPPPVPRASASIPPPSPLPPPARPMVPPPSYMPKPMAQPLPVAAPRASMPRPAVQSQPIAPGQRPAFASLPPKAAMPQPTVAPAPRPKLPVPPIQPSDIPMGITLGEPRQLKNLVQPPAPRTVPPPANLPGAMPSAQPAQAPSVASAPKPVAAPTLPPQTLETIPKTQSVPPQIQVQQAPKPTVSPQELRTVSAPAIPGVRPVAAMPAAPRVPGTPDPYREPIE